MKLFLAGVAAFAAAAFAAPTAYADEAAEASENLRRVREKIEREEDRLNGLKKNQTELQNSITQLASDMTKAAQKKEELTVAVGQLGQELERVSRAVGKIQQDIADRRGGLKRRVVALYKTQRQTAALDYLFHAKSSTDLLKRTRYLSAIASYDRNYLQGLGKLVSSVERDQKRLNELQQQKRKSFEEVEALEKELGRKREEKAVLAAEEREKIKQQEKSLEKLHASAAKFEAVLASIMGGDKYEPTIEDRTPEPGGETPTGGTSPAPQVIVAPFNGRGLGSVKGRLIFPVQGEVIQRFGKQKHDEFADMLFVKGLEIRAPVGAKVNAVAPGKIVLSQVLPGYGNVIIIDHGERYYTLYGRLASSLKSVGEVVKNGDPLAILGEADYKGRNFYFELRIKGKATNPLEYFSKPPRSAAG